MDGMKESFTRVLRITEQHFGSRHVEHEVRHVRIAAAHAVLTHDNLLALSRVQHGHARNRATGLESNRVDDVVHANDEHHVRITKVVIYLVHL